ncbi:MAG: quorum-sensing autoinducer CAI-1 synthase [Alphaproteobacteria bacterium]
MNAPVAKRDSRMPAELAALNARIDRHFARYGGGHITCGRRPGASDVRLTTNDYLALSRDRRILESQLGALTTADAEVYMSGVYVQYLDAQREVESRFAKFLGSEDAIICQSGFAANEGLIQCLADADTPVFLDLYAHASLWQGALVAGAPTHRFRHNDPAHLQKQVQRYGPGVVVVDAIYSTSGDTCALHEMVDVCEEHGCTLVVDESHSMAVIGETGQGLVNLLGLTDRVPYRTFSLSKGFVGRGGVIAASSRFIEYFRYESRPAVFSSVVLPWEIARFDRTLEVVQAEGRRRQRLSTLSAHLRDGLRNAGYKIGAADSQIIPLVAGPEERTVQLRDALESRGIFGSVFSAPATPRHRSLVRLCVNAGLADADIERVIAVCREIRNVLRPDKWPTLTKART